MKFTGDLDTLKERFADLGGTWVEQTANHIQFRALDGAVMSWYPSTGTIYVDGKPEPRDQLQREVDKRLAGAKTIHGEQPAQASPPAAAPPSNSQATPPERRSDLGFEDSELVLGLVSATGTDLELVTKILEERLSSFGYQPQVIKISSDIIDELRPGSGDADFNARTNRLMDAGNLLRYETGDHSVLALAASARIGVFRRQQCGSDEPGPLSRRAFIVSSLKHPEEVHRLRGIYSTGFFLIGVHADERRRFDFLTKDKQLDQTQAQHLMDRDAEESDPWGQHTRDTFHLSDFFISLDNNHDKLKGDLWRVLNLIFGKPDVTPTFDEYAMFMAFSAGLRSADLSRQVGAVIARQRNIVATGANDVPAAGGGLYWPEYGDDGATIVDKPDGRDYIRGFDSNAKEKRAIMDEVVSLVPEAERDAVRRQLSRSRLDDITEYGRMVHAEMEALLACGRVGVSTQGATLYCTTFPCHNCAKHIIAAGIERVVYVEPYPKSKALEFHSDAVSLEKPQDDNVVFAPFVGVGPRSFFNLFSMRLGSGYPLRRKTPDGDAADWEERNARLRMQMLPTSYIDRETLAADLLLRLLEQPE